MKSRSWFGEIAGVLLVIAAVTAPSAGAADPQYRAVFELTSEDPQAWEAVVGNVENLRAALAPIEVEVVAHGKGLALLTEKRNGASRDRLAKLSQAGVVFAACENTMKRMQLSRGDLSDFAITVDAGVAEVVRKQEAGWSYVRSGS
jgi:intracellular sulfur oxidation DsrE/DsrF family protein